MSYLPAYQVAHYAYDAGFRGNSLVIAVAVADAESTFNPTAVNPSHTCFGLWQIDKSHDAGNPSALLDPSNNAKFAYSISNHGTNWSAWTTYMNGSYRRFWSVAESAVKSLTPPPPSYPHTNVRMDGTSFPAIANHNETYLLWTALTKWDIPHQYLGQGKFSINGHVTQGIVYEGNTYLNWAAIPGIQAQRVSGEFNFTDSN